MEPRQNPPNDPPRDPEAEQRLSEELVRQVADKVYAMLMQDLAIERERNRPSSIRTLGTGGGW